MFDNDLQCRVASPSSPSVPISASAHETRGHLPHCGEPPALPAAALCQIADEADERVLIARSDLADRQFRRECAPVAPTAAGYARCLRPASYSSQPRHRWDEAPHLAIACAGTRKCGYPACASEPSRVGSPEGRCALACKRRPGTGYWSGSRARRELRRDSTTTRESRNSAWTAMASR